MGYIGNQPAETPIVEILETDIKIGEDDQTKIDFETANEIHLYANNTEQVYVADNIFGPQSDSDVDLGTTGVRWKDAYVDSVTSTGAITGTTIDATTDFTIGTTVITDDSIVMTPSTSDTVTVAAATNGVLNITTVDNAAAAANLNLVVDGAVDVDSAGAINLDSGSGIWTFEDSGTEVLRFTESGSGDVTVKLETNGKDLIFTDNGDAEGFRILDGAAGVTVAGSINLGLDAHLDSTPTDETVSGVTATFTAGEDLDRGEVVYFKAGDSKMWKAVASASATSRCVAMAAADISADATGKFLLYGFLGDNGSFPAYTVGGTLYTPEAETSSQNVPEQTAPDSDGDFVQVLGFAVTANSVFFNPSNDIIEHA